MRKEFSQVCWNEILAEDWQQLLKLAIREDLSEDGDITTRLLVPPDAQGHAVMVNRTAGVIAGLETLPATLLAIDPQVKWEAAAADGDRLPPQSCLGVLTGPAAGILAAERLMLNAVGRLSGIATLTRAYVDAVNGINVRIYDTRKTTPGWRRLEKYAVRCGGGWNHRTGLFEAVLIKDNHLAFGAQWAHIASKGYHPAQAVIQARQGLLQSDTADLRQAIVEIEVDTLAQLDEVLPSRPDIVLLDNMPPSVLREAVARRNAAYPQVELEASGGVNLATVREIAETGVDRISVGALTHSAGCLDVGLDWVSPNRVA